MGGRRKANFEWWTKERVDNGLQRFIRDFHEEKGLNLPASELSYRKMLPRDEKIKAQNERLYPPAVAILRHYDSMSAAWWKFGHLVEVRIKHPKNELTPEIENMLRKIYAHRLQKKNRPADIPESAAEYARQVNVPKHQMMKWARELGLAETKESPWSDDEIALLDKYGYQVPTVLERLFRKHGFKRSVTAIHIMRKRRMSHKASPYYSANALAQLLGVDGHLVRDWIEKGWLKAEDKDSERRHVTQVVHKDSIYEFICAHPNEFKLKNVDQFWFLHVVTRGAVQMTFSDKDRLGKRSEAQLIDQPREFRKSKLRKAEAKSKIQNPNIRFAPEANEQ